MVEMHREEAEELERVLNSMGLEEEDDDMDTFEGSTMPRLSINGNADFGEDEKNDEELEIDGRPASRCSHRTGPRHSSSSLMISEEQQSNLSRQVVTERERDQLYVALPATALVPPQHEQLCRST